MPSYNPSASNNNPRIVDQDAYDHLEQLLNQQRQFREIRASNIERLTTNIARMQDLAGTFFERRTPRINLSLYLCGAVMNILEEMAEIEVEVQQDIDLYTPLAFGTTTQRSNRS